MKAGPLPHEHHQVSEDSLAELRIWQVTSPVPGSEHAYKYSLACITAGECVLRYDNEAGKGNHKHMGENEIQYTFANSAGLLEEFCSDIDRWRQS